MTAPQRLPGCLLGAAAGYLLTILPCLWDGYESTHRTDPEIVHFWVSHYSVSAIVPMLVGAFVGQSLGPSLKRQETPRS